MSQLPPVNQHLVGHGLSSGPAHGGPPSDACPEGRDTDSREKGTHSQSPRRTRRAQPGTCGFPARDRPEWQITALAVLQLQQLSGQAGPRPPRGAPSRQHRGSCGGSKLSRKRGLCASLASPCLTHEDGEGADPPHRGRSCRQPPGPARRCSAAVFPFWPTRGCPCRGMGAPRARPSLETRGRRMGVPVLPQAAPSEALHTALLGGR